MTSTPQVRAYIDTEVARHMIRTNPASFKHISWEEVGTSKPDVCLFPSSTKEIIDAVVKTILPPASSHGLVPQYPARRPGNVTYLVTGVGTLSEMTFPRIHSLSESTFEVEMSITGTVFGTCPGDRS